MQTENLQAITDKLALKLAVIHDPAIPVGPIKECLRSACLENAYLVEMILKKNRTLSGCATYVEKQVRQQLNNRNGYIPDAEVYGMAEDFYYLSDTEISDLLKPPIQSTCKVDLKSNQPPTPTKPASKPDLQLNLFDSPVIEEMQPEAPDSETKNEPNTMEVIDHEQKTA